MDIKVRCPKCDAVFDMDELIVNTDEDGRAYNEWDVADEEIERMKLKHR